MAAARTKKHGVKLFAAVCILAAMTLRQIGLHTADPLARIVSVLRAFLYIGLFSFWGLSLRRRIMQPLARRCLTAIAALIVFWITVRLIRYSFTEDPWAQRYLWYLYYLPMLFIPPLAVFVSLSLGKPESYRLPLWARLLSLPSALLLLLVLSNDLHQLVFVFPADAAVWANDYRHGIGYYSVAVWLICCTLIALFTMLAKCRLPNSRKVLILPFVPVLLAVVYSVLYIFCMPILKPLAGDMTVVFCLLIAATLESCIQCGLIQSNTGYEALFMVSRLGAQITDQNNAVCLASLNAQALTEEQRLCAETQTVSTGSRLLVRSKPIAFGHVLWQEDVTELCDAIEQTQENCRDLAERNRIRQENLQTQKKILALQEKNRAADLLHRETRQQIDRIGRMLAQYDTQTDAAERRRLLAGVAVIGAYIKRYGNLLLVSERTETADLRDLSRCFDESFLNLELLGVNCLHTLPSGLRLATKDMLRVYRGFETAVEVGLYELTHVWVQMREKADAFVLTLELVCGADLCPAAPAADGFCFEDGAYRFTFYLTKGGGGT